MSTAQSTKPSAKKRKFTTWENISSGPETCFERTISIDNFSARTMMENKESFRTGVFGFNVGEDQTEWCLNIYPNGKAEESKEPGVAQPLLPAGRAQERGLGPGHYPPSN